MSTARSCWARKRMAVTEGGHGPVVRLLVLARGRDLTTHRCRRALRIRRKRRGLIAKRRWRRDIGSSTGSWSSRMCFREEGAGFDAVFGNPPWEIASSPNVHGVFFQRRSSLPRVRQTGSAWRKQREYFADPASRGTRLARLHARGSASDSNLDEADRSEPFGDPDRSTTKSPNRQVCRTFGARRNLGAYINRWRKAREPVERVSRIPKHPFPLSVGPARPDTSTSYSLEVCSCLGFTPGWTPRV